MRDIDADDIARLQAMWKRYTRIGGLEGQIRPFFEARRARSGLDQTSAYLWE